MFHTLHRIMVLTVWGALLCVVVVLYQRRAIFSPIVDIIQAARIREGFQQQELGRFSGQAVKVHDGDTFQIKDERGRVCNIRLTGLDAPNLLSTNRAERLLAGESRTNLSRLILSNYVRVEITYSNEARNVLGIAYVGQTNVNAALIVSGAARAKREYMNGLPLKDRYTLVRAERAAKIRTGQSRE